MPSPPGRCATTLPMKGRERRCAYSPRAACLGLNFGAGARRMTSP